MTAERLSGVRTPSHSSPPQAVAGPVEARGATVGGVQIHSLRLPGYSVTTEIIFGNPDERLHFRHEAGSGAGPYVAGTLLAIREAVPAAVNARIGRAKQTIDVRIAKTAADVIVPFERFDELLSFFDEELGRRGLDAATWGHVSDGNLHPNVIPRSFADVESGSEAILTFGREVLRLGGSPLAEHGVGRNPTKQQLLLEMYGAEGIDQMRAVKRAIDPEWKMAPGVLFSERSAGSG